MFKYSCRECNIRERCINQSDTAARVKDMIRHAFAARTDTTTTWGVLQKNCLLIQEEEERAKAREESMLSRRLRKAKDEDAELAEAEAENPPAPSPPELPMNRPPTPPVQAREPFPPVQSEPERVVETAYDPFSVDRTRTASLAKPYWLTVGGSNRHIALPLNGQVVLGRFDPDLPTPPDVDLTYEDQFVLTVSRQHAKIIGVSGRHTIKDLGSSNGVFLNGEKIIPGVSRQLQSGDYIGLGYLQMTYDMIPPDVLVAAKTPHVRHYLQVGFSGRKLPLAPEQNSVIGKATGKEGARPEIDLSGEGDVAVRVAARHALISWRNRVPYLEDLGSQAGTRLNGESLASGKAVPLKPGDHLWLGGCVLVYDIKGAGPGT